MNRSSPALDGDKPFAVLDDNLLGGLSHVLTDPVCFATAWRAAEVDQAFQRIEEGLARGLTAAGFFSYELAFALQPRLAPLAGDSPPEEPLIQVGLFRSHRQVPNSTVDRLIEDTAAPAAPQIENLRFDMDQPQYLRALDRIKAHIREGDTYQVNFTMKARMSVSGCPIALYRILRERQPVAFGAYLSFPGMSILSRSPELFFRKKDDRIATKPMKGTAPRGTTAEKDAALRTALRNDEKTLAENVMIVDLLRNDFSRVAVPGSVTVDRLFEIETYRSLHQMTSTVSARVDPLIRLRTLFDALFPCGSITGAPKLRTMEIIHALEPAPRGVYTGAIGMITPENTMCFSVPIRTLAIHKGTGRAHMGIGAGIVHDSDPAAEYEETLLKGRFLTDLAGSEVSP